MIVSKRESVCVVVPTTSRLERIVKEKRKPDVGLG